jgi:hypothetical protein
MIEWVVQLTPAPLFPLRLAYLMHPSTSDRIARIPSVYYGRVGDQLKASKFIQDNALVLSVFVLSDMVRCCTP